MKGAVGFIVILVSSTIMYMAYYDTIVKEERNLCLMTYMRPHYENVSPKGSSTQYKLFRYVEGGVCVSLSHEIQHQQS